MSAAESGDGRVVVREATPEDADSFADFFVAAWGEAGPDAPGFTGATDEVIAELTTPEAFRDRVGGPDRRMFLARDGDRVVGFSSTRRTDENTAELSGIIVLRGWGGSGLGTRLVEAAVAAARGDGAGAMTVKTETTNSWASSFYESQGFRFAGEETERVGDITIQVSCLTKAL